MYKVYMIVLFATFSLIGTAYGDMDIPHKEYYYDLGDTMVIEGILTGYDSFILNNTQQEPVKIDITNLQSPEQVFEIKVFPNCINGNYPDCDFVFNNSISLSRELGFTDGVYNVDISYGDDDNVNYDFGINNMLPHAQANIDTTRKSGFNITLDKSGYKIGDTVIISIETQFSSYKDKPTVVVTQIDSPVWNSAGYSGDTISLRDENYNESTAVFTTEYEILNYTKYLGHYAVRVYDQLETQTEYFNVSSSGLETIHPYPYLEIINPHVENGDVLKFKGYGHNEFYRNGELDTVHISSTLDQGVDNTTREGNVQQSSGNRVVITVNYESDDFKTIGNVQYIEMNELGYFEGEILISQNHPTNEILNISMDSVIAEFVVSGENENNNVYDQDLHACDLQVEYIESHKQAYQEILDSASKILNKYDKEIELLRAENYKVKNLDGIEYTPDCVVYARAHQ